MSRPKKILLIVSGILLIVIILSVAYLMGTPRIETGVKEVGKISPVNKQPSYQSLNDVALLSDGKSLIWLAMDGSEARSPLQLEKQVSQTHEYSSIPGESQPEIKLSPDKSSVLYKVGVKYRYHSPNYLYVTQLATGKNTLILETKKDYEIESFAWAPDENSILCLLKKRSRGGFFFLLFDGDSGLKVIQRLVRIDLRSGKAKVLSPKTKMREFNITTIWGWKEDGIYLEGIYRKEQRIWQQGTFLMNPTTEKIKQKYSYEEETESPYSSGINEHLPSPDLGKIAYIDNDDTIIVRNLLSGTKNEIPVWNEPPAKAASHTGIDSLAWSTDQQTLAFILGTSTEPETSNEDEDVVNRDYLYTVNLEGNEVKKIAKLEEARGYSNDFALLSWLPESNIILYKKSSMSEENEARTEALSSINLGNGIITELKKQNNPLYFVGWLPLNKQ